MPVVVHRLQSRALQGNPLGDPTERDLVVWEPPGLEAGAPLPALLALAGFTGTGGMLFNLDPWQEGLGSRLDRLVGSGACPPVRVVAPDCLTRVGGSQYLNSSATGRYEDYLVDEVVPFVRARYGVTRWGVFGKSSGGYGAMVLGMRHPDLFQAVADHSGDSGFEYCYPTGFVKALSDYRAAGGPAAWLERFHAGPNRRRASHMDALNTLAMAACYSPDPASPHLGIAFPFDLETGAPRPEVWERWRAWDPVNMVPRYAEGLRRLRLCYVDCGREDQYGLIWGARSLVAALRAHDVPVHAEEFDDTHSQVAYRYDVSLPLLVRALAG